MTEVTIDQASGRLRDLVDAAMGGEEVVVVAADRGAVRLVPLSRTQARPRFGSAKGLVVMSPDFDAPLDDFREYSGEGE